MPTLEDYQGDGSDLTDEQKEYLMRYQVRVRVEGPHTVSEVNPGLTPDPSCESEYA